LVAGRPEGARGDDEEDAAEPGEGHGRGGGGVRESRRRQGGRYEYAHSFSLFVAHPYRDGRLRYFPRLRAALPIRNFGFEPTFQEILVQDPTLKVILDPGENQIF